MKLITEQLFLIEAKEDKENKDVYIEGIFMQAELANRNGRIYPAKILQTEVNRYAEQYVKQNRALGELNHPESPVVDPAKASHLITDLYQDGNNFKGKAKILDTPMGNVVEGLLRGGVQLGVSSRGMGSIKTLENGINEVQDDFKLSTVDIVHDPSAPDAFVNGIMEGVEWVYDATGKLNKRIVDDFRVDIQKELKNDKLREETVLRHWKLFLKELQK
jgi:hypothetical protein